MAAVRHPVQVTLEQELLANVREQLGDPQGPADEIVRAALNAYLLDQVLLPSQHREFP
jgi:hypothetical protein